MFPKTDIFEAEFCMKYVSGTVCYQLFTPFADCDVIAAVRQLPLYDLAIDKRSYISKNSYSFYRYKNLNRTVAFLHSRILMTKQQ